MQRACHSDEKLKQGPLLLLCFVFLDTLLHSRYIPLYRPTPAGASDPPFCHSLELRRRALRTALCFASLQTSLRSRYIPRCRPNTTRDPPFCHRLPFASCKFLTGAEETFSFFFLINMFFYFFPYCACTEELRLSSGSCCSSLFCTTLCY